jgi:two-component system chemotaxis sensor kinase CheA
VQDHVIGHGIGLAGARRIVEQQGGCIEVESRGGVGTTVTVRLPLAGSSAAALVAQAPGPPQAAPA